MHVLLKSEFKISSFLFFSAVDLKFNRIMIKNSTLHDPEVYKSPETSFVTWYETNFRKPSTGTQLLQARFHLPTRRGLFTSFFQRSVLTNVPVSASDSGVFKCTSWREGLSLSLGILSVFALLFFSSSRF